MYMDMYMKFINYNKLVPEIFNYLIQEEVKILIKIVSMYIVF